MEEEEFETISNLSHQAQTAYQSLNYDKCLQYINEIDNKSERLTNNRCLAQFGLDRNIQSLIDGLVVPNLDDIQSPSEEDVREDVDNAESSEDYELDKLSFDNVSYIVYNKSLALARFTQRYQEAVDCIENFVTNSQAVRCTKSTQMIKLYQLLIIILVEKQRDAKKALDIIQTLCDYCLRKNQPLPTNIAQARIRCLLMMQNAKNALKRDLKSMGIEPHLRAHVEFQRKNYPKMEKFFKILNVHLDKSEQILAKNKDNNTSNLEQSKNKSPIELISGGKETPLTVVPVEEETDLEEEDILSTTEDEDTECGKSVDKSSLGQSKSSSIVTLNKGAKRMDKNGNDISQKCKIITNKFELAIERSCLWNNQSLYCFIEGDIRQAFRLSVQSLKMYPLKDSRLFGTYVPIDIIYNLGIYCLFLGHSNSSVMIFRKFVHLNAQNPFFWCRLGDSLLNRHLTQSKNRAYQRDCQLKFGFVTKTIEHEYFRFKVLLDTSPSFNLKSNCSNRKSYDSDNEDLDINVLEDIVADQTTDEQSSNVNDDDFYKSLYCYRKALKLLDNENDTKVSISTGVDTHFPISLGANTTAKIAQQLRFHILLNKTFLHLHLGHYSKVIQTAKELLSHQNDLVNLQMIHCLILAHAYYAEALVELKKYAQAYSHLNFRTLMEQVKSNKLADSAEKADNNSNSIAGGDGSCLIGFGSFSDKFIVKNTRLTPLWKQSNVQSIFDFNVLAINARVGIVKHLSERLAKLPMNDWLTHGHLLHISLFGHLFLGQMEQAKIVIDSRKLANDEDHVDQMDKKETVNIYDQIAALKANKSSAYQTIAKQSDRGLQSNITIVKNQMVTSRIMASGFSGGSNIERSGLEVQDPAMTVYKAQNQLRNSANISPVNLNLLAQQQQQQQQQQGVAQALAPNLYQQQNMFGHIQNYFYQQQQQQHGNISGNNRLSNEFIGPQLAMLMQRSNELAAAAAIRQKNQQHQQQFSCPINYYPATTGDQMVNNPTSHAIYNTNTNNNQYHSNTAAYYLNESMNNSGNNLTAPQSLNNYLTYLQQQQALQASNSGSGMNSMATIGGVGGGHFPVPPQQVPMANMYAPVMGNFAYQQQLSQQISHGHRNSVVGFPNSVPSSGSMFSPTNASAHQQYSPSGTTSSNSSNGGNGQFSGNYLAGQNRFNQQNLCYMYGNGSGNVASTSANNNVIGGKNQLNKNRSIR